MEMHFECIQRNTPEEIARIKRVVAGSNACKGPDDAKLILQALGVIPTEKDEERVRTFDIHSDPDTISNRSVN